MRIAYFIVLVIALSFPSESARAVDVTTASGSNGADTWVASNAVDDPLGVSDANRKRIRSDGTVRTAYLRFDLSAMVFAPAETAAGRLKLFADEADDINPNTVQVFGILDGAAGDALEDWSEARSRGTFRPMFKTI